MAKNRVGANSDASLLDAQILAALEASPRIAIPPGFAARVAGQLPPLPAVVVTPPRYGIIAATACVLVLLVLMQVFAHATVGNSPYSLVIESILCLQFVLLTVWIVARNAGYTLPNGF